MQLTHDELKKRFPNHPDPAPREYAGEWVAWDRDRRRIYAHGKDFGEVCEQAKAAGCQEPVLQMVSRGLFIGRA